MSWTPKPGDRVTSPLLVGEWTVDEPESGTVRGWWLTNGKDRIREVAWRLAPVAPPLPPEPPVGSVVWAQGRYWIRRAMLWLSPGVEYMKPWEEIAADAVPVVPVNKVADWLRLNVEEPGVAANFLAEFGGFDA